MPADCPVRHPQAASQVVDGQAVVVQSQTGQVTLLNPVGTRVWDWMDGTRTITQIAEMIESEYAVTRAQAVNDTTRFVNELIRIQAAAWSHGLG